MSANPPEIFTASVGANKPPQMERPSATERRGRARTKLHLPVLLFRQHASEAIGTVTENLSSSGFYCLAEARLTLGETLLCSLKVPTHDPSGTHLEQSVECKIRVIRIEPRGEGIYGIACRIEDYQFVHTAERG